MEDDSDGERFSCGDEVTVFGKRHFLFFFINFFVSKFSIAFYETKGWLENIALSNTTFNSYNNMHKYIALGDE